jgi:nucleotide-binding universal stress UspA family protein
MAQRPSTPHSEVEYLGVGRIVVGVDGSDSSRRAVAWAADEAKRRRCSLLLVHAYDYGLASATPYPGDALAQVAEGARVTLDDNLVYARSLGVMADGHLQIAPAVHALVDVSRHAYMLVVGSRGRGVLTSGLFGSVSAGCVHHAHCPVIVVPGPEPLHHRHADDRVHPHLTPVR